MGQQLIFKARVVSAGKGHTEASLEELQQLGIIGPTLELTDEGKRQLTLMLECREIFWTALAWEMLGRPLDGFGGEQLRRRSEFLLDIAGMLETTLREPSVRP